MTSTGKFLIASEQEILAGETTDIYFKRTAEILQKEGLADKYVVADFTPEGLPNKWTWAVFCGLGEVLNLMEGHNIDLYALPEGTIFRVYDEVGIRIPVMVIKGSYGNFCIYETPLLGLICQATGVATVSARIRKVAGDTKQVLSFGIRRMHPVISPMLDYYAYIGGCDAVSSLSGAKAIGKPPRGTMPHALVITYGDQKRAFKAFYDALPKNVPFVALVDTYSDEKHEAILATEVAGKDLYAVRLDTPSSRRGNFARLVQEVRWELDVRGYNHVKIFVSGGIDEDAIRDLVKVGVDGFGVGTAISNAPTVNFAMDIVEVEGKPAAKRGKFSGAKRVYRCPACFNYKVTLERRADAGAEANATPVPRCSSCNTAMESMLVKYLVGGKRTERLPSIDEMRIYVLNQLTKIELDTL
jgi:nicotinate phosphoribosyltransferase